MATLAWAATIVVAVGLGYSLRPTLDRPAAIVALPATSERPLADSPAVTVTAPSAPAPESPKSVVRRNYASAERRPERQAAPTDLASAESAAPPPSQPAVAGHLDDLGNGAAATLQRQGEPAKPATPIAGASGVAMVDGTPVDTTVRHLAFGPPTVQAPRRITLDEAVNQLGGSIRLIDGLAPQRVELLSGVDVPGADPDRQVVRVYYEEPDLGLITLDQQRPAPSFAARDGREDRNEAATPAITVGPQPAAGAGRAMARMYVQPNTIAWRSEGVWLALTSHRAGVKMSELQARVK
jgi:hypothetical protein